MSYKYEKYRRSLVVPFVNKSTPSIYIDRYTYTNADTHTETDADTDTYTYRVRVRVRVSVRVRVRLRIRVRVLRRMPPFLRDTDR